MSDPMDRQALVTSLLADMIAILNSNSATEEQRRQALIVQAMDRDARARWLELLLGAGVPVSATVAQAFAAVPR